MSIEALGHRQQESNSKPFSRESTRVNANFKKLKEQQNHLTADERS